MNSAIYRGWVRHRRFSPALHEFKYNIFFLWLDLDEISAPEPLSKLKPWFSTTKFAALRFNASDYLDPKQGTTRAAVWQKVQDLGGEDDDGPVYLLGQVRCLGFYFSPVNFFYCYDQQDELKYVVAEVSNTPWNKRHYYLVDTEPKKNTPKEFHVSPFMSLDMAYLWRIPEPNNKLCLHIENHNDAKLFDATLVMTKYALNNVELKKTLIQIPAMSFRILSSIYWQALRIWLKRIPYVPYSTKDSSNAASNK